MEFLHLDPQNIDLKTVVAKDISAKLIDPITATTLLTMFYNHKTTCILHPGLLDDFPPYLTISTNDSRPLTIVKIEGSSIFAENYCKIGPLGDFITSSLNAEDIQLLFGSIGLLLDSFDNCNPLINQMTTEHMKGDSNYNPSTFSKIMSATKMYRNKIIYELTGYSRLLFFWEYCKMNSSVTKYANEARAKFLCLMTGKEIPLKNVKAFQHTMTKQVKELSETLST